MSSSTTDFRHVRIFHGLVNIAGIGRYLADDQRAAGFLSDFVVQEDRTFRQNSHWNLRFDRYATWQKALMLICFLPLALIKYDLFHFYAGESLWPWNLDLPLLKLLRKKVIITYCGSESRLVEIERKRNPHWEHLKVGIDHPKYDASKKRRLAWQSFWADAAIAARDTYAPVARFFPAHKIHDLWVNNMIDLDVVHPGPTRSPHSPLVIHAPSGQLKGTSAVERAVVELQQEGLVFTYRRIENTPNVEMQRILREEADIVVDQLILGAFGSLAVEGMAYGLPVICYLAPLIQERHFPDCPIVSAGPDDVKSRLRELITDAELRIQIGHRGRRWVERHLDRRQISAQVLALYESLYR